MWAGHCVHLKLRHWFHALLKVCLIVTILSLLMYRNVHAQFLICLAERGIPGYVDVTINDVCMYVLLLHGASFVYCTCTCRPHNWTVILYITNLYSIHVHNRSVHDYNRNRSVVSEDGMLLGKGIWALHVCCDHLCTVLRIHFIP